ncbi:MULTISPECIES: flagellar biosynthesis anti-sigma factor FlgM [Gammaproteobacteria]|jgi:negative regulator of flagellin synthesis FlgM|uniref:Negative regulator of flagellin synthesis n=1 Tax=Vreelandella halophila TaxID=86177 RepID=A0A9X4YDH6_9GAMM|nr:MULTISPECIES: flagellar biosynthesis anti-sigma factor FlgM [Gammaproteobacteria]KAA8981872.1 flagellar biosynthesis anti-sigma factor FlgM [Halospina sp. K52047b]MYL27466.1 flagellar biosynthesis anti-sigma factor FlgM [Halomonas utahensis]MYL74592.1 flagellar biosynthesis anti-sigma factor FlgM [Halomonas sp. 22501_18_FS]
MAIDFNGANNNALNTQKQTLRQRDDAQGQKTPQQPAEGGSQARESTRVDLSPDARNIKAAEQTLQQQPEVDDAKVSRIREALEDGSYSVDAEKLAQKMLDVDDSIFG